MVESQPSKLLVAGSIPVSRSRNFLLQDARDGGFEQAAIRIENEKEFEELKHAINRAFGSERVEAWLKQVRTSGVGV